VDGDSDLVMEDSYLEGFREFQDSAVCSGVVENWRQDGAELCEAEY